MNKNKGKFVVEKNNFTETLGSKGWEPHRTYVFNRGECPN